MKSFYIPDLVPLEDFPRESSLRFLTQVWRNLGSFSYITQMPPFVRVIDGVGYLEDGNHRSVWCLLNGIDQIDAEEEMPNDDDARSTMLTLESVRNRGVYSVGDLVSRIRDPRNYSREGPVTHVITRENLQDPDFLLRI